MKKAYLIVSLVMVGILLISTMVLAFIPKNFQLETTENPDYIDVYYKGVNIGSYRDGDSEYENILDLYNDSFKTGYLTAMFDGLSGVKPITKDGYNSFDLYDSAKIYILFNYNSNPQSYDKTEENIYDNEYTNLILEVSDEKGFNMITTIHMDEFRPDSSSNSAYYETVTYANQSNLYDYLAELDEANI